MTTCRHSIRLQLSVFAVAAAALLGACGPQGGAGDPALAERSGALIQDNVITTGQACVPTGKHSQHARFQCATCHQCAGTLSFDPAIAGPTATFDATTKNCSNVNCHAVPAGNFYYYDYDGILVSVPYGGQAGGGNTNWYAATGAGGCDACHGYPPSYNGVKYAWHSGMHGINIGNGNACQLCHPDASGAYVYGGPPSYVGTSGGLLASCPPGTYCAAPGTITSSAHANGVLDVTPLWKSTCFGCH